MLLTVFLGVTLFSGWLGWIIGLALVVLGLWLFVVIIQIVLLLIAIIAASVSGHKINKL